MKSYKFTTEKTTDGYSAYYEDSGGGVIAVVGDTVSELKSNALQAVNLTLDYHRKKAVSAEAVVLVFDIKQFCEYYNEININKLAPRIGINRSLLSQYINGTKKPSPTQTNKILIGVKSLGKELVEADFA